VDVDGVERNVKVVPISPKGLMHAKFKRILKKLLVNSMKEEFVGETTVLHLKTQMKNLKK
jgi:hypothetical protein